MSVEKERKAFEAWLKSLNENGRTTYFLGQESTVAWEAWQASANREGHKLVPIKCTNNMAHAAKEIDGRLSAFKYGDVWEAMVGACDD